MSQRHDDLSTADLAAQRPTDTTPLDRAAAADVQRRDPTDGREDLPADEGSRERALGLAIELRRAGIAADLDLAGRSSKGQMKQADRSGAKRAVILEGDATSLREMETGEQRQVDPGRLVEEIRGS